jgi:glutathione S-transferase
MDSYSLSVITDCSQIDPYAKPKELTDINPRGLVPALMHGEYAHD